MVKSLQNEFALYNQQVTKGINRAGKSSIRKLVRLTKETAPVGLREGAYRDKITSKEVVNPAGSNTYVWGVKAPEYRLTHLLVHGHATKDGGRTPANSFLADALDQVLPEYEKKVEKVLRNGK